MPLSNHLFPWFSARSVFSFISVYNIYILYTYLLTQGNTIYKPRVIKKKNSNRKHTQKKQVLSWISSFPTFGL